MENKSHKVMLTLSEAEYLALKKTAGFIAPSSYARSAVLVHLTNVGAIFSATRRGR